MLQLEYQPTCPLVATLAEEALEKLEDFVSQNVSNMLWAFARFNYVCRCTHILGIACFDWWIDDHWKV